MAFVVVKKRHERHQRIPWRPCLLVFAVALGVRLLFLSQAPERVLRPNEDWEPDAIAMSLVTEGQFANPYIEPTGPTAHVAPVLPFILALIYKVFGITLAAGIVGWLVRMVAQSAIWGMLPWIGERVGLGWKAGLTGGLAGALFPQWTYGEALAAVCMGLLVMAIVRRWESVPRPAASLLFGAAFGVAWHVQPVFLAVFLGYLGFELWRRSDRPKWSSAGLALLGALLISIPWGVRNYRAFDAVFFVRSNLGLELLMGNHEGATPSMADPHFFNYPPHPRTHREDAIRIRESGEVPYMRQSGSEALDWIGSNPGEFARLTAKRVRYFWLGPLEQPSTALLFGTLTALAVIGAVRSLRRLPPGRSAALLIPLLTYPLIYYLVPWQRRYRFPIEWILFLLAGVTLWSWAELRWSPRSPRKETLQQTAGADAE